MRSASLPRSSLRGSRQQGRLSAGLAALPPAGERVPLAGGDFADGLIAYEGNWLGAETFVSFDKRAVSLITKQGAAG
jgi:hypothetical protein